MGCLAPDLIDARDRILQSEPVHGLECIRGLGVVICDGVTANSTQCRRRQMACPVLRQGDRGQARQGHNCLLHTYAGGQSRRGADTAEVGLNGGVRSTVRRGGAGGTRTPYLFNAIEALSQLSYSPTIASDGTGQIISVAGGLW